MPVAGTPVARYTTDRIHPSRLSNIKGTPIMPRRTSQSQSAHDAEVRRIAKRLENQGFEVRADLSGYPQPATIGGVRPDIDARHGRQREIVEVETRQSEDGARAQRQQQAFERAANRAKNTKFTRKVIGK